jgi:Flp pilus assembly protein TadG
MTALDVAMGRAFAKDERGVVAPVFGLMCIVLFFITGMAIDFTRVSHSQAKIAAAADVAALAAGRAMLDGRLTDAEVKEVGLKYFQENVAQGGKFGDIKNVDITLDRSTGSVKVDIDADVPMTITRIEGFEKANLDVRSAVLADQRDIELGLALDVTGSMSGSKIADLRQAAKDLVDILLPDGGTPNKVRIGLAPYSNSVNAGSYAATVTSGTSANGCVRERGGAEAFTDALPSSGIWLGYTPGMYCPSARIVPLSSDKNSLKAAISAYAAGGSTAGHLGAAWAWYLVSPEWATIWPSASKPEPYNDGKTMKAIVLMTDGMFNTWFVPGNGDSAQQARSLCSEMKREGVIVFSVAFMAPSDAQRLLKSCASSSSHFFDASNGTELRSAFIEIANQLNNLRLTQ